MVTIYNTTLSATSQRHFSDGLGGASCASVRAFIFEVVDKIANKYIYLFRDLVV